MTGESLRTLLEQYSDTTFFLERLLIGLKEKEKAGDWDKSFGVKEATAIYTAGDADEALELPEENEGKGISE